MSKRVLTPKFLVSFPSVFQPRYNQLNGKNEYGIEMVFPEGTNLGPLKKAMKEVIDEKWPNKVPKDLRIPLKDGSEAADDAKEKGKDKEIYRGKVFCRAKAGESNPPIIVNEKREEFIDERDFYAGCQAHAYVNISAYDKAGNRGISFWLDKIQKTGDGEPLGAMRTSVEDDFEVLASEAVDDQSGATDDGYGF